VSPKHADLKTSVEAWIDDELLYREARALGLDQNDGVVRRRLIQKMGFFLEEQAGMQDPGDGALQQYLDAHATDFTDKSSVSFAQAFFSRSRRGARAESDARQALAQLQSGKTKAEAASSQGDPCPVGERKARSVSELDKDFGPGFGDQLANAPDGVWSGPVRSAYGFHLVYVTERTPGRVRPLGEVRAQVLAAYRRQLEKQARAKAVLRLRERTPVERDPDWDNVGELSPTPQRGSSL
jgi:hypothetical protein